MVKFLGLYTGFSKSAETKKLPTGTVTNRQNKRWFKILHIIQKSGEIILNNITAVQILHARKYLQDATTLKNIYLFEFTLICIT